MLKFCAFLFFIISLAFGSSVATSESASMDKLQSLHEGLEKRKLLLRHQIARVMEELDRVESLEAKKEVYAENIGFFQYLLGSVNEMKVSAESKSFMKSSFNDLIQSPFIASTGKASLNKVKEQAQAQEAKEPKGSAPVSLRESKFIEASKKLRSSRAPSQIPRLSFSDHLPKIKPISKWSSSSIALSLIALLGPMILIGFVRRDRKRREVNSSEDERLRLRMFSNSALPVIFVDQNETIYWSNKTAEQRLELTQGSSFFYGQELSEGEEEKISFYQDEEGRNYFVEKRSASIKGENYQVLMFIQTSIGRGANTSFRKTAGSLELGAGIQNSLEKHNYLFSSSSIPVSVNQKNQLAAQGAVEHSALDNIVYLSYQMAKDVPNTRVDFTLDSNKGRTAVQVDIRGLKGESVDLEKEVILFSNLKGSLGDLWNELELSMSHREGRIFMYENTKEGNPSLTIIVSFKATEATRPLEKTSGELYT